MPTLYAFRPPKAEVFPALAGKFPPEVTAAAPYRRDQPQVVKEKEVMMAAIANLAYYSKAEKPRSGLLA